MNITKLINLSLGKWRSQQSSHRLALDQREQFDDTLEVRLLSLEDHRLLRLCREYQIKPEWLESPIEWIWDDSSQEIQRILLPIPDPKNEKQGQIIQEQGDTDGLNTTGTYLITEDGVLVLSLSYGEAIAEERLWYVTPNLRFRVTFLKTNVGGKVTTASFFSETRLLNVG